MEELFSWTRPILSGLAGGIIVWLMIVITKSKSRREGDVRHLEYGKPFKIFCVLLVPFAVFVAYAASQSAASQTLPAFLVASGFLAAAIYLPYQAFFVQLSYDNQYIYYKSPLAGAKKVPWENLQDVGYSRLAQADYMVVEGIGRIWFSHMLNGYAELCEFLEHKLQDLHAHSGDR